LIKEVIMSKPTQTFEYLAGKKGRIYVSRNGTVSIYVLSNGETWLHQNTGATNVIFADPAPAYWRGEATEAQRYQYLTMQIERDSDNKPAYA
jgi:hypothetical protein